MRFIVKYFGKKVIFPFYHTVSDENCPHIRNLYPVKSTIQFEKELDFFQKHYYPISLEEIQSHIINQTQPEKPSFFLSFDDGLKECHTTIAPILKRRNIPAAFFINTGFVGNLDLFYRYKVSLIVEKLRITNYKLDYSAKDLLELKYADSVKIDEIAKDLDIDFEEFLQKEMPYMNWEDIKELSDNGFYIGGHSVDHPYFNQVSLEEQIRQTKQSVDHVVNYLKLNYKIFSFPFTDLGVKKSFFEKIYDEKFCDLTFGTAGIKNDEFSQNLQRIPMDNCLGSPKKFMLKNLIMYNLKKLTGQEKVIHP